MTKKSIEDIYRRQFLGGRGRDFRGMDLSGLNLSQIDFTDAILDGANLSGADVRGTIFRRSSLVGANLNNIRSGLPKSRSLFIEIIFTLMTTLGTVCVFFTSSSLVSFMLDETRIFTISSEIENLIPWHRIAAWMALITGAIYSIILIRKNPTKAVTLGGLSAWVIQVIVSFIVIRICISNGQSWKVIGHIIIYIVSLSTMMITQIVAYPAMLALIKMQVRSKKIANLATILGTTLAIISVYTASASIRHPRFFAEPIIGSIAAGLMYVSWQKC